MIPLIQQAIAIGWTSKQILDFLSSKSKNLAPGLESARRSGYRDEDILKFLQGKIKTGPVKEPDTAYGKYLKQSGILTPEESKQRRAKGIKAAIGVGATALGAYNAYKSFGSQGLGSIGEGLTGMYEGAKEALGFSQPTPGEPPTPGVEPTIEPSPAPEVSPAPAVEVDPFQKSVDVFKNRGIDNFLSQVIPQLPQGGVRSAFNKLFGTQNVKDMEREGGKSIEDLVGDFMQASQQEPELSLEPEPTLTPEIQEEVPKISEMITPDGDIGTVESIPGKTAKLNIDGKKKVVKADDLTPVPGNKDEILDLYERLIQAIPEDLRSSNLNWVGYDPTQNLLQVKFHNGASYTYEDVPEEFANKLENVLFTAKTTGGNYFGNWSQGDESRGAGVAALIRELQKQYGKGQEYSAKFREVYSFLGLPEQKLREKMKREREERKKARKAKKASPS